MQAAHNGGPQLLRGHLDIPQNAHRFLAVCIFTLPRDNPAYSFVAHGLEGFDAPEASIQIRIHVFCRPIQAVSHHGLSIVQTSTGTVMRTLDPLNAAAILTSADKISGSILCPSDAFHSVGLVGSSL